MKFTEQALVSLYHDQPKKCPNCGSTAEKAIIPESISLLSLDENEKPSTSLPVVGFCCTDCGYISLFNLKFLKAK